MPAPGAHGFPWAIQDQQALGQPQSSGPEAHRALLLSAVLPSTRHLTWGLHGLAMGAQGPPPALCHGWCRGLAASSVWGTVT